MTEGATTINHDMLWFIHKQIYPIALAWLPGQMDYVQARAMVLATALQESDCNARVQGGRGTVRGEGPAHGLWQFEKNGGVAEILTDFPDIVRPICNSMLYAATPKMVHLAIADNDVLACILARLLLWKDPLSMPERTDPSKGWLIYKRRWRPGSPGPARWPSNFAKAWSVVNE